MSPSVLHVIAWFNRSEWDEIKSLCAPNDLQNTYDEWLANIQVGMKAMGVAENDVIKSIITPDDLRDWQAANVGEIDSKVRARLAVDLWHKRKNASH